MPNPELAVDQIENKNHLLKYVALFLGLFFLAAIPSVYFLTKSDLLSQFLPSKKQNLNSTNQKPQNQSTNQTQDGNILQIYESRGLTVDTDVNDSIETLDMESLNNEADYQPINTIYGDGSNTAPYQVTDNNDPMWQKFKPNNLQSEYDEQTQTLSIFWEDDSQPIIPYMYLAGYWYEDFDPAEKFNIEQLEPQDMVQWSQNVPENNQNTDVRFLSLNLNSFSRLSDKAYYYLYVRTKINNTYVDFIYGSGNNLLPYSFDLK